MDLESFHRWYEYARVRDKMLGSHRYEARTVVYPSFGRRKPGSLAFLIC
jgi:hypothetical protein